MGYEPIFTIRPTLLGLVEEIIALREKINGAAVELPWIPAIQKDSRSRNAHATTAIEGNPLTLEQVRAIAAGIPIKTKSRARREVLNYFASVSYIENNVKKKKIGHTEILELHKIIAEGGMDQGEAGRYRTIFVKVGRYTPPNPLDVSGLMFELLEWWNKKSTALSPVLSSAILHYRFEHIHPFADGNGRTGRAIALWELFRRGFDQHHIFSIDEFYWENRPAYYHALANVTSSGENMTKWLEYCAEGLKSTLHRVWERIRELNIQERAKIPLSPKQEKLLKLLAKHQRLAPAEIWRWMKISKQGAMDLLHPLLESGLVKRIGTKKNGYYSLNSLEEN